MSALELEIPVEHPQVDSVRALHEPCDSDRAAVLLAHGAGAPMDSPFLSAVAAGLVQRGFAVLRFDYPYMERKRRDGRKRPPDPAARLESAHAAALETLRGLYPSRRIVLAGKSLGGRMASHLAAKGHPCAGLVFLGYPLHPPKQPGKLRHEHFAAICQPALFLTGTRDALCDLELLRAALLRFGGRATLHVVEDADHSFAVRKSSGRQPGEVQIELLDAIDSWEREALPS